jgi:anti-anti-sigma factor
MQIEERGDALVAHLTGEASLATIDEMDRALEGLYAHEPKHLVLDLSGLTFISSHAMGQLVSLRQRVVEGNRGWVKAAGLNGHLRGAFHYARLDELFDITDTVDAALA